MVHIALNVLKTLLSDYPGVNIRNSTWRLVSCLAKTTMRKKSARSPPPATRAQRQQQLLTSARRKTAAVGVGAGRRRRRRLRAAAEVLGRDRRDAVGAVAARAARGQRVAVPVRVAAAAGRVLAWLRVDNGRYVYNRYILYTRARGRAVGRGK